MASALVGRMALLSCESGASEWQLAVDYLYALPFIEDVLFAESLAKLLQRYAPGVSAERHFEKIVQATRCGNLNCSIAEKADANCGGGLRPGGNRFFGRCHRRDRETK